MRTHMYIQCTMQGISDCTAVFELCSFALLTRESAGLVKPRLLISGLLKLGTRVL